MDEERAENSMALGLRPDRIKTLVSMTTDIPHRVIMGNMLLTF